MHRHSYLWAHLSKISHLISNAHVLKCTILILCSTEPKDPVLYQFIKPWIGRSCSPLLYEKYQNHSTSEPQEWTNNKYCRTKTPE